MMTEERAREAMRRKILERERASGCLMTPEKRAFLDEQIRNGTMISTEHPDLEECRKLAEEEARYGKGRGFRWLAREMEMGILDWGGAYMHLNVPVALLVVGCLVLGTWGLALLAWRGVSAVRGSTFPGRAVLAWLAVLFAFVFTCAAIHLWAPSGCSCPIVELGTTSYGMSSMDK